MWVPPWWRTRPSVRASLQVRKLTLSWLLLCLLQLAFNLQTLIDVPWE